eukprot:TRINITY_DN2804_c0_g1_i1.p2 TRINITY_DN2804_c0_g1~~TRINITY_DN2804_c0_g1_i1.p2  ORF type:complete len:553 (+),score=193.25 TRINITY_DN2804_c0_g1_i1:370-2028(+)
MSSTGPKRAGSAVAMFNTGAREQNSTARARVSGSAASRMSLAGLAASAVWISQDQVSARRAGGRQPGFRSIQAAPAWCSPAQSSATKPSSRCSRARRTEGREAVRLSAAMIMRLSLMARPAPGKAKGPHAGRALDTRGAERFNEGWSFKPTGEGRALGDEVLAGLRRRLEQREEQLLSPLACLSRQAVRRRPDPLAEQGHRLAFAVDADRVLHSLAYTRYIDKTQVFSLVDNDQISHRVLHVQLVSKIGRGLGRMLGLNEDLIEAIALAHDLGHPPFGHDGETFLSRKCVEHGLGPFRHNLQSVHFLERLEKGGQGLNLSLQVLDGVLAHDGESHTTRLSPERDKDFATLDQEMADLAAGRQSGVTPMTLEGCLVRVTDTIAYVGRDLEDAIALELITRDMLPAPVREVLGESNGTMVYRLVEDLAANSLERDYVAFSPEVGQALGALKAFNLEHIYTHPRIKTEHAKIAAAFELMFERYLEDLKRQNRASAVFVYFLAHLDRGYAREHAPAEVVRDFLASMTDDFFLQRHQELVVPRRLPARLNAAHSAKN